MAQYLMSKPTDQSQGRTESFRQAYLIKVRSVLLMETDLQHQVWLLTLDGRLHTTQLPEDVRSILDIGCGTGAWVLAMAAQWPSAQIVATDITLPAVTPPTNLALVESDADEPWPFQHRFEFIHGRMLASGIHDWSMLLTRCWEHLEPRGQLELLDICHPFRAEDPAADNQTSAFIRWGHAAEASWNAKGLDYRTAMTHTQRLQALGFKNVEETQLKWPLGEWAETGSARRIGALTLQNFATFLSTAGNSILAHNPSLDARASEKLGAEALADLRNNCCRKRYYLSV